MELTPKQALELAQTKRREVFESVDKELDYLRKEREEQARLSNREKSALSTLAFTIAAIVLSFKLDVLDNCWILLGLFILLLDSFVFGFVVDWYKRKLNVGIFEKAMKQVVDEVRPFFDAYDELIKKEPPDQSLFNKQQDAYIEYLERQKKRSSKFEFPEKFWLDIGDGFLWLFGIGLLLIGIGLLQDSTCIENLQKILIKGI